MISNKVLLNNIPVFNKYTLHENGFQISPFVHLNLLWTPELSNTKKNINPENAEKPTDDYNPIHLSAGFGVSMISFAASLEIYYNAYLKKNSHDVGREFSIKLGLD